uniref:inositol monophosphatase family protein n=1 Tax=Pseudomonas sp. TaxID=306 RepID=UPI002583F9A9|nr:inositol monophosphatase family protein [Pseudomonas sp.]
MFVAGLPLTIMTLTLSLHVLNEMGRSYFDAGLVATATALGFAVGSPLLGRMMDRHGLRPVVVICGTLSTIAWVLLPLEYPLYHDRFEVNQVFLEYWLSHPVTYGLNPSPWLFRGGAGLGAWRADAGQAPQPIRVRTAPPAGEAFTVVASRRHSSPEQERLLAGLADSLGELALASVGSSLKFCLLAEGAADCYPRLAPTSQWDTAAAQGVLEGAGGEVLDIEGQVFTYPARESLLNTFFLALPAQAAWRETLLRLAKV